MPRLWRRANTAGASGPGGGVAVFECAAGPARGPAVTPPSYRRGGAATPEVCRSRNFGMPMPMSSAVVCRTVGRACSMVGATSGDASGCARRSGCGVWRKPNTAGNQRNNE